MSLSISDVISHPLTTVVAIAAAAGGGLLGAIVAIWQGVLARRALRTQSLVSIQELSLRARHAEGMAAIRELKRHITYEDFLAQGETRRSAELIYDTVKFLNFAAHLVEVNALPRQVVWNLYFFSYRESGQKLLTWWLTGQRAYDRNAFGAFERMCAQACSVSESQIRRYDRLRPWRKLVSAAGPWLVLLAAASVLGLLIFLVLLAVSGLPINPASAAT